MSRLGKLPIPLVKGVSVLFNNKTITVKGPKGTLERELVSDISLEIVDDQVIVSLAPGFEQMGNLHGLWRQLINNMIIGTSVGYEKKLQLVGVGYRAIVQGKILDLQLGYSHPTQLTIPDGIEVKVEKNTNISVLGIDKQAVGQFAADIRDIRKPEPYKGKGVRYENEYVRRKAGKAGKK